jgi:hypothetical protein
MQSWGPACAALRRALHLGNVLVMQTMKECSNEVTPPLPRGGCNYFRSSRKVDRTETFAFLRPCSTGDSVRPSRSDSLTIKKSRG